MACIFCGSTENFNTIEHIVSESLGNKMYTLEKGDLCDKCNNSFAKFEKIALAASIIGWERARNGTPTKNERPAKGLANIGAASVEVNGDAQYRKDIINLKSRQDIVIENYDPKSNTGQFTVNDPDEGESVAISKLLLKMGIEALFQSQGEIYDDNIYDFSEAKKFVLGENKGPNWPFIMIHSYIRNFEDILDSTDIKNKKLKDHLLNSKLKIEYLETAETDMLFKFSINKIGFIINLANKKFDWIGRYIESKIVTDKIYPPSVVNKFRKQFKIPNKDISLDESISKLSEQMPEANLLLRFTNSAEPSLPGSDVEKGGN